MITKEIDNFNIEQICNSGQCFRMEKTGKDTFSVIAGDKHLEITQRGGRCMFHCEEEIFEKFWKGYFDLETNYGTYIESINPNDTYLVRAAERGGGIRILRQDLWEMIVSFLISQQNNIVRIRRCISNICREYGEKMTDDKGNIYYAFPAPEKFAELNEDALKDCNLGYRSKYVVRTAKSILDGEINLEEVRRMSYRAAKEELLKLFGVGEKVADCICLFALHHLEAFPVDTHINQALKAHYKRGFPKRRYKGYQGVIQQYIFYYELGIKEDSFHIRRAEDEDLGIVKEITHKTIQANYPHYYAPGAVQYFLSHHRDENIREDIKAGNVWLVEEQGGCAGTVTINENEINRLFVLPKFQGKGLGRHLMDFGEKYIRENYTTVTLSASFPAWEMYERRGYTVSECRKIACKNGDFLPFAVMGKQLCSHQP